MAKEMNGEEKVLIVPPEMEKGISARAFEEKRGENLKMSTVNLKAKSSRIVRE